MDARELYKIIFFSKGKSVKDHTFVALMRNIVDTMSSKYTEESLVKPGNNIEDII